MTHPLQDNLQKIKFDANVLANWSVEDKTLNRIQVLKTFKERLANHNQFFSLCTKIERVTNNNIYKSNPQSLARKFKEIMTEIGSPSRPLPQFTKIPAEVASALQTRVDKVAEQIWLQILSPSQPLQPLRKPQKVPTEIATQNFQARVDSDVSKICHLVTMKENPK